MCRNYDNHEFNSLTHRKLYLFNGTFKALVQQNVRQDKCIIHSMQIEGNMMTLCMLLSLHWSNYNDFITRNHLIAGGNCNEFPISYKQGFAYHDKQYLYNDTYWREIIMLLAFGFRIIYCKYFLYVLTIFCTIPSKVILNVANILTKLNKLVYCCIA